jgi:hypothetical protein
MAKQSKTRMGMYSIMLPNLEKKSSMQKKERTISTQKTRLATPNVTLLSSKKMRRLIIRLSVLV